MLPALGCVPLGEGVSDDKQFSAPHVRQATRRCEASLDRPWRRVKELEEATGLAREGAFRHRQSKPEAGRELGPSLTSREAVAPGAERRGAATSLDPALSIQ